MEHRHFRSDLTQAFTIRPVKALILSEMSFLDQLHERSENLLYKSYCTQISTRHVVMPHILSKAMWRSVASSMF